MRTPLSATKFNKIYMSFQGVAIFFEAIKSYAFERAPKKYMIWCSLGLGAKEMKRARECDAGDISASSIVHPNISMDRFSFVVKFRSAVETTHELTMADRESQLNATPLAFPSKSSSGNWNNIFRTFVASKIGVY